MTINIPIESYKRLLEAVKILEGVLHTIPESEREAAEKIVAEIKKTHNR